MNKKHKKICIILNYSEHLLTLVFLLLLFLLGITIGITISSIGLKVCTVTAESKKDKSVVQKYKNIVK